MSESPSRFTILACSLAVATALVLSGCADSSGPLWAAPAALDELASEFGQSDLGMDAGGNAIAVWSQRAGQGAGTSDYTVSAARFTPGIGWGPPAKLGSSGERGASQPVVAVNAQGHAVAAWWEWGSDREGRTGEGVWAARFDPQTGWDDPVLVGEAGRSPDLALNDRGRAALVWIQSLDAVFVSHLDPASGWDTPQRLDRDCIDPQSDDLGIYSNPSGAGNPRVAMNDRGHLIVVWDDNESETGPLEPCEEFSLRASSYVPGVGWSASAKIGVRSTPFGSLHAAVALDDSGRGIAGSLAGEVRSYGDQQGWSAVELGLGPGKSSVAMTQSGHAIVAWEGSDPDLYPGTVQAARFSPDGGWSQPETVSDPRGQSIARDPAPKSPTILDSSGADVAINEEGECVVVWHQVGLPAVRSSFAVWANRYRPGLGWGAPTVLATDATMDAFRPRVVVDAEGRGIALWTEASHAWESSEPARLMWSRLE